MYVNLVTTSTAQFEATSWDLVEAQAPCVLTSSACVQAENISLPLKFNGDPRESRLFSLLDVSRVVHRVPES